MQGHFVLLTLLFLSEAGLSPAQNSGERERDCVCVCVCVCVCLEWEGEPVILLGFSFHISLDPLTPGIIEVKVWPLIQG